MKENSGISHFDVSSFTFNCKECLLRFPKGRAQLGHHAVLRSVPNEPMEQSHSLSKERLSVRDEITARLGLRAAVRRLPAFAAQVRGAPHLHEVFEEKRRRGLEGCEHDGDDELEVVGVEGRRGLRHGGLVEAGHGAAEGGDQPPVAAFDRVGHEAETDVSRGSRLESPQHHVGRWKRQTPRNEEEKKGGRSKEYISVPVF